MSCDPLISCVWSSSPWLPLLSNIMVYIDRWKLHEVIMYLLKAFIGPLKEGKCSFDVSMFMQTVVLPGMASNGMRYCAPSV